MLIRIIFLIGFATTSALALRGQTDVLGSGQTRYSGTVPISIDAQGSGYRLFNSQRNIHVLDFAGDFVPQDFTNPTTNWDLRLILDTVLVTGVNSNWIDLLTEDPGLSPGQGPDLYSTVTDFNDNVLGRSLVGQDQFAPPTRTLRLEPGVWVNQSNLTLHVRDDDGLFWDELGSAPLPVLPGDHGFSSNGTTGVMRMRLRALPAVDIFWGLCKSFDFYLSKFNRWSYNGTGGAVVAGYNVPGLLLGAGTNHPQNGASTNTAINVMYFGRGWGGLGPYASLDIVAHEYTHLVISEGSGLSDDHLESRALNESFCDIMAAAIEAEAHGVNGVNEPSTWLMGEQPWQGFATPYLRNMGSPWLNGHSGSYGDQPWDNNVVSGDPYVLSGVQNRWFYLLVNGGSATYNGISYSVAGISLDQAIHVVYENMMHRLGPNSNYQDAVSGSIAAAQALYPGTNVELEVKRAWHAVGLYPDPLVACGTITLSNSSGSFEDGSTGLFYGNGLDCAWHIVPIGAETITLDFTSFNVAAHDTVYIYGGESTLAPVLAKYSGSNIPASIVHQGSALFVRFVTDASGSAAGWSASYSSDVLAYCSSAEYPFNAASGSFEDGSGTNLYRPNTQCGWYIAPPGATSVTLSFTQFQTEATQDVVKVYPTLDTSLPPMAVLSGASIPSPVTSPTGQMFIAFETNSTTNLAGWSANYTSTGSGYCGSTSLLNATSGSFTDGSGLTNYNNNTSCSWLIQPNGVSAVQLAFTSFDVEPASSGIVFDKVVVRDGNSASAPVLGTFYGSNLPGPIVSSGPALFVEFITDNATTAAGWAATYTGLTGTTCSGTTLLTAPTGSFTDGSGTGDYANNSVCNWLIQPEDAVSIVLTFDAFNTQLNADGIIVYDGQTTSSPILTNQAHTGTSLPPVFVSSGGAMLVRFVSDASITAAGFQAHYVANISEGGNMALVGYEYWFDENTAGATYHSITPTYRYTLDNGFDTDELSTGLHTFHIRFKDNEGGWSSVLSQSFYKGFGVDGPTPSLSEWEYWFDEDHGDAVTASLTGQTAQVHETVDADNLPNGLHTVHTRFKGSGGWSSVLSQSFYKTPSSPGGNAEINGYEYWYDEGYASKVSATVGPVAQFTLSQAVDAANLPNGLHTLHIRFDGTGGWSSVLSQSFYKAGSLSTLPNKVDAYRYWFDDAIGQMSTQVLGTPLSPYSLAANISTTSLSTGSHAFHIQFRDLGGSWSSVLSQTFTRAAIVTVAVPLKVFLEGPYSSATQLMSDGLRTSGLIPLSEPFTSAGFTHVGQGGGETIAASVLSVTGNNAIVDWILVEARSKTNSATVVNTRSALIQRDGDVVELDGVSPLTMQLATDLYYVAVRHRNHLGAMTLGQVSLSGSTALIDFTSPALATYGNEACKTVGGKMVLWTGNARLDNSLKYTGTNNDRDRILVRVGNTTPNNIVLGYYPEDLTLDGSVKYTGTQNDRDPILVNVGSTTPNNVRLEQLP